MNSPKFSISVVTAAMIGFTVLCNSRVDVSPEFLFGFLALLHVGLVWMVVTILKAEKPVSHAADNSLYNKAEINKG